MTLNFSPLPNIFDKINGNSDINVLIYLKQSYGVCCFPYRNFVSTFREIPVLGKHLSILIYLFMW